jgi:hypothetical protein
MFFTSNLFCITVFLSFCLSVFLSFCLSVFLSFCISVFLYFCLSVFLYQFLFCLILVTKKMSTKYTEIGWGINLSIGLLFNNSKLKTLKNYNCFIAKGDMWGARLDLFRQFQKRPLVQLPSKDGMFDSLGLKIILDYYVRPNYVWWIAFSI